MPDRYEDGIRALQGIEAPDQWDGIRQRANGGLIVPLDWDRRDQRRRWHTLLAAAAALLVVVGVAALFLRDEDDVTTDPANPGLTPPTAGPGDPSTTAQPPTTRRPSTTDAPIAGFGACPRALEVTTTTAPPGWSTTMAAAEAALPPNRPAGVDQRFAGLFTGPTTGDNVFVIAGLPGRQDDAFIPFPGPVPGRSAQIAPFDGGWYMELVIPHPAGACWITLEAIGMTQGEAISFAQGLRGS